MTKRKQANGRHRVEVVSGSSTLTSAGGVFDLEPACSRNVSHPSPTSFPFIGLRRWSSSGSILRRRRFLVIVTELVMLRLLLTLLLSSSSTATLTLGPKQSQLPSRFPGLISWASPTKVGGRPEQPLTKFPWSLFRVKFASVVLLVLLSLFVGPVSCPAGL